MQAQTVPSQTVQLESLAQAPLSAPALWHLLLEARAPLEAAALCATWPLWQRLPRGDGHAVVVFPGLGASDLSTLALRGFLRKTGYAAEGWDQGFNLGPRPGVLAQCQAQVQALHQQTGRTVSLVGWSLGGIYAREVAKALPQATRCVVTLGTPFTGHPKATNAWRLYEWLSGHSAHDAALLDEVRKPPKVPTTSIYSRSDGIVAWPCSINPAHHRHTENIEVQASHVGMAMNPLALYAVLDRLREDPKTWQRFDVLGARRWFYKAGLHGGETAPAAPESKGAARRRRNPQA